jgi:hypothetical protein
MIFGNGIMITNQTTKGNSFVFAPTYWFPWGLQDEDEKNNDELKGNDEFIAEYSAVNIATDIAKMISSLNNKK